MVISSAEYRPCNLTEVGWTQQSKISQHHQQHATLRPNSIHPCIVRFRGWQTRLRPSTFWESVPVQLKPKAAFGPYGNWSSFTVCLGDSSSTINIWHHEEVWLSLLFSNLKQIMWCTNSALANDWGLGVQRWVIGLLRGWGRFWLPHERLSAFILRNGEHILSLELSTVCKVKGSVFASSGVKGATAEWRAAAGVTQ